VKLKVTLKIVASFMLIGFVSGCGDGNSETNGTLTLSATAPTNAGVVTMTATSVLTPIQVGSEISFTTIMFNGSGALPVPAACSGSRSTDLTGTATISCNITQPAVDATLQISATSAGLSSIPVSIPIPGL